MSKKSLHHSTPSPCTPAIWSSSIASSNSPTACPSHPVHGSVAGARGCSCILHRAVCGFRCLLSFEVASSPCPVPQTLSQLPTHQTWAAFRFQRFLLSSGIGVFGGLMKAFRACMCLLPTRYLPALILITCVQWSCLQSSNVQCGIVRAVVSHDGKPAPAMSWLGV